MKNLLMMSLCSATITFCASMAMAEEGSYGTSDLNQASRNIAVQDKDIINEEDAKRTAAEAVIYNRYMNKNGQYRGSLFGYEQRMHRKNLNRSRKFIRSMGR